MKKVAIFIFYIAIIALIILLYKAIFESVYYSDLPAWLKYILLRG